jgi:adenylylsulfate kinase-like enzyme
MSNVPSKSARNVIQRDCIKKSRKGEIKQFTGIDQPYEEPQHPEVIIDTNKLSSHESLLCTAGSCFMNILPYR